jgi:hypothetical protein
MQVQTSIKVIFNDVFITTTRYSPWHRMAKRSLMKSIDLNMPLSQAAQENARGIDIEPLLDTLAYSFWCLNLH